MTKQQNLRDLVHNMMKDMLFVGSTGADSLDMQERYMPIYLPMFEEFFNQEANNRMEASLILFVKDMKGYDFMAEEPEEDTNALVADALEKSKAYVLKKYKPKEAV